MIMASHRAFGTNGHIITVCVLFNGNDCFDLLLTYMHIHVYIFYLTLENSPKKACALIG